MEFDIANLPEVDLVPELANCVDLSGAIPIIRHPLVHQIFYMKAMNHIYNKTYEAKVEALKKAAKQKRWSTFVFLHEKPYRLETFWDLVENNKLTNQDFNRVFRQVITDSENIFQFHDIIRNIIDSGRLNRKLMLTNDEKTLLRRLPDEVRVFRGYQSGDDYDNQYGFSWTLSLNIARWFANRYSKPRMASCVVKGIIAKQDILGVFLNRGELEVFVDPYKVRGHVEADTKKDRPEWLENIWTISKSVFRLGPRSFHGVDHWENVERNAEQIAAKTEGADLTVVWLFAALHDCKRQDEDVDPEHGDRSAAFAKELYKGGLLPISEQQLDKLYFACKHHQNKKHSADPTIGSCWDADRLDLYRVGIVPSVSYLSTEVGKELLLKGNIDD